MKMCDISRKFMLSMAGVTFGLAILVSSALGAAPGKMGDWPQFRGPQRDGKSTESGLLTEWAKEGPPLAWRVDGLGKGYSTISFSPDKIFTMGDRDKAQYVIALDRSTHKEAWATRISDAWSDGGPRCTPTIDGDRLYALSPHGNLVCLVAGTGKLVWQKHLAKDFGGKMMSGWGYSESPLVDSDKLLCTPGGAEAAIVALDKKTGEVIWKTRLPDMGSKGADGAGYSAIVVSDACGIHQYVQLLGRGVVGVAADDGRFLWGYNRIANHVANIPTPIVSGNFVFSTSSYKTGSVLLEVTPAEGGKGLTAREVWFLEPSAFENHHGGVVLVDGYLYGGEGQNKGFPTCIELKTGKIRWHQRGPGDGSAAVLYAEGRLYFRYENNLMALLEASSREARVISQFKLPTSGGPSWPYPVILDGMLYLRHEGTLLCYDIRAKS